MSQPHLAVLRAMRKWKHLCSKDVPEEHREKEEKRGGGDDDRDRSRGQTKR